MSIYDNQQPNHLNELQPEQAALPMRSRVYIIDVAAATTLALLPEQPEVQERSVPTVPLADAVTLDNPLITEARQALNGAYKDENFTLAA